MDGIYKLAEMLKNLAPKFAPQMIPADSVVSSGDPHNALASCFSTQDQKTELLEILSEQQRRAEKTGGGKVFLSLKVELNIRRRLVIVRSIQFVGEVERNLLSVDKFLQLQVDGSEEEVQICADHFVALNERDGFEARVLEMNVVYVQEVYSVAYALKVLLDNVPNWTTCIGAHAVPIKPSESVTSVMDSLLVKAKGVPQSTKRKKIQQKQNRKRSKRGKDLVA